MFHNFLLKNINQFLIIADKTNDQAKYLSENSFLIQEEEFFTEDIIQEILDQIKEDKNKTMIIFDQCNFDNFSKCFLKIIKNKEIKKRIKTIYLCKCEPKEEIEIVMKDQHEIELKLISSLNEPPIIEFLNNFNSFITIKKKNFLGFSYEYKYMQRFMMSFINFFALMTVYSPFEYMYNIYLSQDFIDKKFNTSTPLNISLYLAKIETYSYFSNFYKYFEQQINQKDIVSYKIIVFKDNSSYIDFIHFFEKAKSSIEANQFISANLKSCLFFYLINLFSNQQQKYFYLKSPSNIKSELKKIFDLYYEYKNKIQEISSIEDSIIQKQKLDEIKFDLGKHNIEIFNLSNQVYLFAKINDRNVLIYSISERSTKNSFGHFLSIKEKDLFKKYNMLNINYILYKLINEKKLSEQKAIELVYNYFIEYILIN